MSTFRHHLDSVIAAAPRNEHLELHQYSAGAALQRSQLDCSSRACDATEDGDKAGVRVGILYSKPSKSESSGGEITLRSSPSDWE